MNLLLALALVQSSAVSISGHVVDASGGALAGAMVTAICGTHRVTVYTDSTGSYRIDPLPDTRCQVTAALDGFANGQQFADLTLRSAVLDFKLAVRPFASQIVVTPTRGTQENTASVAQAATVASQTALERRPYTVVTQALKEEAGVLAQQTTSSQGSPILRGFTGQRNVYLIDGVRYNTAAWRDGPSQYMAWLPAADVDHIELVRGPASTQYGSDALGGTVGVFARPLSSIAPRLGGTAGFTLGVANQLRTSDAAASYSRGAFSFRGGASFASADDLRAGQGVDSHSAVTRFLGLPSTTIGTKLENTGYTHSAVFGAARVEVAGGRSLTLSYRHGDMSDDHRYDQEIGGNGQYRSEFGPQVLDFGFVRYESARQAFFDEVSATVSINRQDDGRLTQTRPGARIDQQANTTTAYGYSAQATKAMSPRTRALLGGELFDERIDGWRTLLEPNGTQVRARPDIPDNTRYRSVGLFWQQDVDVIPNRWSMRGGLRYGHFRFTSEADSMLGVPGQEIPTSDTTFQASTVYSVTPSLTLTFSASRGFRAANAFDFGAIGLSGGAGFEISPQRAVELRGLRGSTDGASAISTGQPIHDLDAERLLAYEAGVRWQSGRVNASITAFNLEFHDAIERRTLIFPVSIVGQDLAGYTVIRQDDAGRAYVQGEARPIVTRVNVSHSRIRGFEAEANVRVASAWRTRAWASIARGTELETGLPRRRMPPGMGGATLTWQPPDARWWIEGSMIAATPQDRLSDGDIGDARIGASRTPASIASFFNGTATDRGLVSGGRLVATGETLAQVQARVLNGASLLAMYTETPGFIVFGARAGVRLGSHVDLSVIGENLGDRNYRLHGSGVDEPGVNVIARLRARF
ncbi:MAG TPA: TonB-dependent receptor [Vicinamibacterales bacterium]|nr:TonB-dependent receptor [Vicinamibacterales bacterium]